MHLSLRRTWPRCTTAALLLSACALAKPAPSRFVVLRGGLADAEAERELIRRAEAAWRFDIEATHLEEQGVAVELQVLPDSAFDLKREGARTVGCRLSMPVSALAAADFDGVLAHELWHAALNARADVHAWPRYVNEGQAFVLGGRYRAQTGGSSGGDADRDRQKGRLTKARAGFVIHESRKFSAHEAKWKDPRADGFRNVAGILFVEFLEKRWPDTLVRLAAAAMATRAKSADESFQSAFGTGLHALEDEFIESLPVAEP
jgi:hypothetical protein